MDSKEEGEDILPHNPWADQLLEILLLDLLYQECHYRPGSSRMLIRGGCARTRESGQGRH